MEGLTFKDILKLILIIYWNYVIVFKASNVTQATVFLSQLVITW